MQVKSIMYYFPDDIWSIIKSYQGFQKYYLLPSSKIYKTNTEFTIIIHKKCSQQLHDIIQPGKPQSLIILQLFLHLIHYNAWIQVLRRECRFWDKVTACIATECNSYLEHILCGCGEEHCSFCNTHHLIDRISRIFYTMYLRD